MFSHVFSMFFHTRPARLLGMLLLAICLSGCDVTVYSGISESDTNEMLAALSGYGIAANKVSVGKGLWDLQVDERLLPRSLEILVANGLPRSEYKTMGDIFKKDSMVSTPVEERARLVFAISQELAGTIAQIDGVLAARVHIVLPEVDSFGAKTSESTASVFIKHRQDVDLTAHVSQIKRMVENSVRDMKYESISVFLFAAALPAPVAMPPEVSVFGFQVAKENAQPVLALCIFGLLTLVGGGAFFARQWHKRKSLPEN